MEEAAVHDWLLGSRVGNYQVTRKLGEGGMGAVYLAEHPLIGKKVALKVLHNEFSSNQDVVARFFNEAKAVNDIQHPNIVDILDYGEIPAQGGQPKTVYFIMEFLDGESLSGLIHQGPLAPERALRIAIQIADALAASHRHHIVHRDLKPDNVILIERRRQADFVKVLDFGIAKLTGDRPGSRRTRTGIVMGTPAYMSPEQCEGRGEVDHRTDIYALGVLLYEMITGKPPFEGEGYGEVLVQHLTRPPAPLSSLRTVPAHVEAVCLRALEKHPDSRYPTMDEFIRALADPVAYVESAGGVPGFTSVNLGAPQATPYPPPKTPITPLPGSLTPYSPAPGQIQTLTPMPGQVHMSPVPGQVQMSPIPGSLSAVSGKPNRKPMLIAGVAGVALAAIVAVTLITRGGGKEDEPKTDPVGQQVDDTTTTDTDTDTTPPEPDKNKVPDTTTPPPPPPPIKKVTITFDTAPAGAAVHVADQVEPLCAPTPCDVEFDRSTDEMVVTFKKDGYLDKTRGITPSEETRIKFPLTKAPEAEAKKMTAAEKRAERRRKAEERKERRERERKERERKERDKAGKCKYGKDCVIKPKFD